MQKFKGTPGPWSIGYYGDGDGIFIAGTYGGPDPTYICSVRPDLRSSQSESNANLIAAAPDLLEALQDFMANASGDEKSCGHSFECVCRFDKAKAAIAKALGK